MGAVERFESPVERQIREAVERGEFDNLPGAGKPLPDLGESYDPDWWLKGLIRREQLDMTAALPPGVALRKEAATYPETLADLSREESVRVVLEDFNHRVRRSRLEIARGPHPPILAPTVDVDGMVRQWRVLREKRPAAAGNQPAPGSSRVEEAPSATSPTRPGRRAVLLGAAAASLLAAVPGTLVLAGVVVPGVAVVVVLGVVVLGAVGAVVLRGRAALSAGRPRGGRRRACVSTRARRGARAGG